MIRALVVALIICTADGFSPSHFHPSRWCSPQRFLISTQSSTKLNELKFSDIDIPQGIELPGKHKWLGGAIDAEGRIYGVPSNAKEVICLAPNLDDDGGDYEMHTIPLPKSIAEGEFKWLRGIIWNNFLFGIPAWSQHGVLRIDIGSFWETKKKNLNDANHGENDDCSSNDNFATVLPFPDGALDSLTEDGIKPERWLWHGAAMNQNETAIYAIPSNAHQVLKIDLLTQTTSLLPIPVNVTPLSQTNKWYGGILGEDNAIYGIPYAAAGVLRIDANTDTVELLGEDEFGVGKYNWHGGIKHPENGKIYCFPAHNDHVLSINTVHKQSPESSDERLSLLRIHRAPYDLDEVTKYKWLGGSLGADGNIYGMPSDASSILRIDTKSDIVTTFGKVSDEKNKYQGGTLAEDGHIYAIPSNSNNILCIDTNEKARIGTNTSENQSLKIDQAFVIGDIQCAKRKRTDKWQGGFVGRDKMIYCIPENFNQIMKVIPKQRKSEIHFL